MADTGDSGATLHAEFNKGVKDYTANYTNPVTSGQIQDSLRKESKNSPDKSESTNLISIVD
jgi:hypothetical protein